MTPNTHTFFYFRRKVAEMLRKHPHAHFSVALFRRWEMQSYNDRRPDLQPPPDAPATGIRYTILAA